MYKPQGYAQYFDPYKTQEIDTYTCAHCCRVTFVKPKEPPYGTCKSCMGFICAQCYHRLTAKGEVCKPLEKWLIEQEKKITVQVENQRRVAEYK